MTSDIEAPESHGIWRKGIWYPMCDLIKSSAELGDPKITDIVHNGKPSSDTPDGAVDELKDYYWFKGELLGALEGTKYVVARDENKKVILLTSEKIGLGIVRRSKLKKISLEDFKTLGQDSIHGFGPFFIEDIIQDEYLLVKDKDGDLRIWYNPDAVKEIVPPGTKWDNKALCMIPKKEDVRSYDLLRITFDGDILGKFSLDPDYIVVRYIDGEVGMVNGNTISSLPLPILSPDEIMSLQSDKQFNGTIQEIYDPNYLIVKEPNGRLRLCTYIICDGSEEIEKIKQTLQDQTQCLNQSDLWTSFLKRLHRCRCWVKGLISS